MKNLEQEKFKQAQTFYNQDYWGVLSGPDIKIYQAGSISSGQLIKIYLEISNHHLIIQLSLYLKNLEVNLKGKGIQMVLFQ